MDFSEHPLKKHNDNVSNTKTNNVIVNETQVNLIAEKLIRELGNPSGRLFYCKVGWKLPEASIWNNLELAQTRGRDPKVYFSWLCKREMG